MPSLLLILEQLKLCFPNLFLGGPCVNFSDDPVHVHVCVMEVVLVGHHFTLEPKNIFFWAIIERTRQTVFPNSLRCRCD
jgi:hypothetical protein